MTHLRHALRLMRLRPGSSAAVVMTLALAIAANSTLFTLVNALLLAPLPVRDPASLVNVYTSGADGSGFGALSYPDYLDLRESNSAFQDALGYSGLMVTHTTASRSEVLFGEIVTPNYFSMLGVKPALGRAFDEARQGPDTSVVIGHRFWRRQFGADPAAIGRTLTLNGRQYTIAGVAPAGFAGLLVRAIAADVWLPVSVMGQVRTDQRESRGERWMFVKSRVPAGGSVDQSTAAAHVVSSRLAITYPQTNTGRVFRVLPTSDVLMHPEGDRVIVPAVLGVMLAGGLVLLVACANLAGVMLARGLARRPEIAIRLAIGASRRQIVHQLLVEGAVLAAAGGGAGLLLARWCAVSLAAWRPDLPVPVALNPAIDWRVATFTLAVTAIATLLFALMPALQASRTPAAGSRTAPPMRRRAFGLRDGLLVPQVAVALVLVAVAGLFARSLSSADSVDPGFDPNGRAFVSLNLAMSGYDQPRAQQFYAALRDEVARRGSVTHMALSNRIPLDLYGNRRTTIATGDRFESERTVQMAHADRGYFETLGIPIVRGRAFDASDERSSAPPVAIVSAAAARQLWPDREALGQRVRLAAGEPPAEVIGIAHDVKVQSLGEAPESLLYLPLTTGHAQLLRVIVRTDRDPQAAADQVRAAVRALDPAVAVFEARSMADHLRVMLYPYRLAAGVGAMLGLLTLTLAGIGLYGVLACGVSERVRELAIRVALGAAPAAIVRTAATETLRAAALGIGIGTVLALAAGQLLRGVLFGISPADPLTLGVTIAALLAVVLLSSAGPIRRALRLAPMSVLRQ